MRTEFDFKVPLISFVLLLLLTVLSGVLLQYMLRPHYYADGGAFEFTNEFCSELGLTNAGNVMGLDLALRSDLLGGKEEMLKTLGGIVGLCHSSNLSDWKNHTGGLLGLHESLFGLNDTWWSMPDCGEASWEMMHKLGDLEECIFFRRFEFYVGIEIGILFLTVFVLHWLWLNYKACKLN